MNRKLTVNVDVDQIKNIFSDNLVYWMHKHRISFSELAGMLGLNVLTVRNWVNQMNLPRTEHMVALVVASGIFMDSWVTRGGVG